MLRAPDPRCKIGGTNGQLKLLIALLVAKDMCGFALSISFDEAAFGQDDSLQTTLEPVRGFHHCPLDPKLFFHIAVGYIGISFHRAPHKEVEVVAVRLPGRSRHSLPGQNTDVTVGGQTKALREEVV